MKMLYKISIAVLLTCLSLSAHAGEKVAIIVNSNNTQNLTLQEIKNIYNEDVITWRSGKKIDVYNLPAETLAREIFAQRIQGISAREAAQADLNRKITNSSRNAPREKRERLVAASVARKASAIGYVNVEVARGRPGIRVMHILEE